MDLTGNILFLLLGAAIAVSIMYFRLDKQRKESHLKVESLINEKQQIELELSQKEFENRHLQNDLERLNIENVKRNEVFAVEFENLANKILHTTSEKFTQQNKNNIDTILLPLQEKINLFEKKVESTHRESIDYHAALREQIFGLREMSQQMSKETIGLTRALKGEAKMQGNWGELILERVLEKSGLTKDREYFVQQSYVDTDGKRLFPDIIIQLPDGKKMVVDSKVSLTAYERYVNEEDPGLQPQHLREHCVSINRHIAQLSSKKYEDIHGCESPDFILLFIPIEPAFSAALSQDSTLYTRAFDSNIVIVTPATLLATLRTIDSMWTNHKQRENAHEIARQAGALYDKFEGFVQDLIRVGSKISDTQSEYENAMSKLKNGSGNLISRAEKIKKLGAKAKKSLPENILIESESNTNQNILQ